MNEDLQLSSFVDGGVEQSEKALYDGSGNCKLSARRAEAEVMHPNLVRYIGACLADVSVHLSHDANVFIAVQKRVLLVSHHAIASTVRSLVGLEAGIGQDDDQALSIFVSRRNGNMLLCNQLREFWRWT